MNPNKNVLIEEITTFTEFKGGVETIESTRWFPWDTKEPGQPGVFEVNGVPVFDDEPPIRRFAYFNGKAFGPVRSTPEAACEARFEKSRLGDTIEAFSGLVEQA